jgi:uncharacterized protein YfaS (alpha-2-macroglobulin family)
MRSHLVFAAVAWGSSALVRPLVAQDTLRVFRAVPTDSATPTSVVTVTFDRPIVGTFDKRLAPDRVLRFSPELAGVAVWRDPVTIRFTPKTSLPPGARYVVTVDTVVRGLDGTRLVAPYTFEFRVNGPRLLARSFDRPYGGPDTLAPNGGMHLLYSAPIDLARLQSELRIELSSCPAADTIPLRAVRQRPVASTDFSWTGGSSGDSVANRLRRVVDLEPTTTLPLDCNARVAIPTTSDDSAFGRVERFNVRTAPMFRIAAFSTASWPYPRQTSEANRLLLRLTSPVRRVDVLRDVRINGQRVEIEGTTTASKHWVFLTHLEPRTTYTVTINSSLRDIYDRALEGPKDSAIAVVDHVPELVHAQGIITIPRSGPATMPLRSVNVGAVRLIAYRVPDSVRVAMMSAVVGHYDVSGLLRRVVPESTVVELPRRLNDDITTELPLPPAALAPNHPLVALRVQAVAPLAGVIPVDTSRLRRDVWLRWPDRQSNLDFPYVLLQVTDLAVTARFVGLTDGAALVTGLGDGRVRSGVVVSQFDKWGRLIGRGVTDRAGVARLTRVAPDSVSPLASPVNSAAIDWHYSVLRAESGDDHVTVSLGGRAIGYEPGSPIHLAELGARMDDAPLVSGAIFADRGIFRPGEVVHLKGVVRRGVLGALETPSRTDSARIVVRKQPNSWLDDGTMVLRDTVIHLSDFGTVVDSLTLRTGLPLAEYVADLRVIVGKQWRTIRSTNLRLAEYKAPQFAVDLEVDSATRFPGDTIEIKVRGQYLFGAPMRKAPVRWSAMLYDGAPRELRLPRFDGWTMGDWTWWTKGGDGSVGPAMTNEDTLDADGRAVLRIPVSALHAKTSGVVEVTAGVLDVDNQWVITSASASINVSRLVVLTRAAKDRRGWRLGQPATVEVRTVDVHGRPIDDAVVHAMALHHRWKEADPAIGKEAAWVTDTLRAEDLRPGRGTSRFTFTPNIPGEYAVLLSATDAQGAVTHTSLSRTVVGPTVAVAPTGYHLPLTLERADLSVGETARVHFISPFADGEAWITVEREGVIEQRHQHAGRGDNVVAVPIVERYTPNVFISVVLAARAENAARPDTATERLRIGYVEVHVDRDRKRLSVAVAPERSSYAPRDTAAIRVRVRDADGHGIRSEVALWAVDEGVLALTGFQTPDALSAVYAWRGVGSQLWSTLPTMLTNDPRLVSVFMRPARLMLQELVATSAVAQEAPAAPAPAAPNTLRSLFRATAFYLGQVETNARGEAVARASVPDNLTTFRVMAVAVSADDRFGGGDTTLLVTRPLVARAALPRFVRPTDSIVAGVVVTTRDTRSRPAMADASATGLLLDGPAQLSISLSSGASTAARFVIRVPARDAIPDSVSLRLGARDGVLSDATETWLPVRPDFHPRTHAIIGAIRDSEDVVLPLPADIDPVRSRLRLRIGTSPLSAMLAATKWLQAYRHSCTEQLTSVGRAMIAVWRATRRDQPNALGGDPRPRLQRIADAIVSRQEADGSISYWPDSPWTTPWLTAYAGLFLLDARDIGIAVDSGVIARASRFLTTASKTAIDTGGMNRYEQRTHRLALGDRVAAVDFLRRAGRPDTSSERSLLRLARAMTWEDRLRLAEVIAPRVDLRAEASAIVDAAWRTVTVAGQRVDLPDSSHAPRAFPSRIAPAARLLSASLVLRPSHPLLGALTETVLQQGRAESRFAWSTQDYSSVVIALAGLADTAAQGRVVRARAGSNTFVARRPAVGVDTSIVAPLTGMLEPGANGQRVLRVHMDASAGDRPVYFALEVDETPLRAPVTPDMKGIAVERWYERFDNGAPITRVSEGDLVRVRLRVTVPADREFVALEDPLPAGLEPIDLTLRTSSSLNLFATPESQRAAHASDFSTDNPGWQAWIYGGWDGDHWGPWEHKELHDDRVSYFARMLWTGSYTASYVARATTSGSFVAPPAYAEEMYNLALQGRTAGARFVVDGRP